MSHVDLIYEKKKILKYLIISKKNFNTILVRNLKKISNSLDKCILGILRIY